MSLIEWFSWLYLFSLYSMLALVIPFPLTWYLLAIFYPKDLLEHYLAEPQFTRAETRRFRHYPGTMITVGFTIWIMCFPNIMGKRRKMTDIRELSPAWFKHSCYFMMGLLAWGVVAILSCCLSLIIAQGIE